MLYCHDPIKPLQCPWPWNINWHQRFQEWMKKWISEETQKCIEHKQTIIIRMIIVERNVRSLIERCHPRDYLSRNTFWPRSVFHRLWRQNNMSICSIRWRVLIRFDKMSWQGASIISVRGLVLVTLHYPPGNLPINIINRREARDPAGDTGDRR